MIQNQFDLFSTAPMLDWSDKHCRYFWRTMTKKSKLYTEMVTTGAIIYGKKDYLAFNFDEEHPIALQLGGADPADLAVCAKKAVTYGYDEINLNVGCPSDRVQNGGFGASLMLDPKLVSDCVYSMREAVDVPITVKCRIGVDDHDSYDFLCSFIDLISKSGCSHFIIHARKAWLDGLSPKENREIPPLKYETVYNIKKDFPSLRISINGGVKTLDEVCEHLKNVDGVMVGRKVYEEPYDILPLVDEKIYKVSSQMITREEIFEKMIRYCEQQLKLGVKLSNITRHILGLYAGIPGARTYRRILSKEAVLPNAGLDCLKKALQTVLQAQKDFEEHELEYQRKLEQLQNN